MRRTILLLLVLVLGLAAVPAASAQPAWLRAFLPFPETIALPNEFAPEGIAIGPGGTFYVGSIPTGAIYRGNVITGQGSILVPGTAVPNSGRSATGLDVDVFGRLFVSGGGTGRAWVYNAWTGAEIASYELSAPPTFINDVVVTRDAAYFTDSRNPRLYRVAVAPWGVAPTAETVPLTGDLVYSASLTDIDVNGIDATPDGKTLVLVQSNTGKLFTADPQTGVTEEIVLSGGDGNVVAGDGILLDGKTLYVVQNRLNKIAVIHLAPDLSSGTIVGYITAPANPAGSNTGFSVPTTIAEFGNRLYAVNARFGTPSTPGTPYWVTQVRKP